MTSTKKPDCEVYRNLHKDLWSVRSLSTRRVVDWLPALDLVGCEFRVSESGRLRVIRQGKKNVHAVVRGTLARRYTPPGRTPVPVTYNPYAGPDFVERGTGRPILRAGRVRFQGDGRAVAYQVEFKTNRVSEMESRPRTSGPIAPPGRGR